MAKLISVDDDDVGNISSVEAAEAANKLWLAATCQSDLEEVERLYRWALSSKTPPTCAEAEGGGSVSDDGQSRKKTKSRHCGLNREQFNRTGEKLALLLCQSGRSKKAKKGLMSMGYVCRLAEQVLDYPHNQDHVVNGETNKNTINDTSPCQIIDGFLSKSELEQLRLVFESPDSSYWTSHNYSIDPPSPYFSYVVPLEQTIPSKQKSEKQLAFGFIGDIAQKIIACPILSTKFPQLQRSAKYVELWAHNRPHASGHQMVSKSIIIIFSQSRDFDFYLIYQILQHFDSDDEGRGGVRNPIISTILYISAGDSSSSEDDSYAGGPTLVTNQKLTGIQLASKGWMAHAKPQRLVAFDGRLLHGVIPGKSYRKGRRVTLMMAFWEDIEIRSGVGPGSARPFPVTDMPVWASQLTSPAKRERGDYKCVETSPIKLNVIYETLDGKPWKREKGMPSYDQVFQGF